MDILKNAKVIEIIKPKMIPTKNGDMKLSGCVFQETFTTKEGPSNIELTKLNTSSNSLSTKADYNICAELTGEIPANA